MARAKKRVHVDKENSPFKQLGKPSDYENIVDASQTGNYSSAEVLSSEYLSKIIRRLRLTIEDFRVLKEMIESRVGSDAEIPVTGLSHLDSSARKIDHDFAVVYQCVRSYVALNAED